MSTYSRLRSVFSRKIPLGNSFSWLFPKYLPTNIQNQGQLCNKKKINNKFVLAGSLLQSYQYITFPIVRRRLFPFRKQAMPF